MVKFGACAYQPGSVLVAEPFSNWAQVHLGLRKEVMIFLIAVAYASLQDLCSERQTQRQLEMMLSVSMVNCMLISLKIQNVYF